MYNKFSDYLFKKYNKKVYKLPVNIPVTCPNRDGNIDKNPCIYCGDVGAGFESLDNNIPVKDQIIKMAGILEKRYKPERYLVYFQNFSNTYLNIEKFKEYINDSIIENVVGIYISTRPDCITDEQIEYLSKIKSEKSVDIVIELGLQTINYKTLKKINRNHSLAEYIDTVLRLKAKGIEICTHVILDIPYDGIDDVIETAKVISSLKVEQVKCHSLYIVRGTQLAKMFRTNEIKLLDLDDFIERVIVFLEYLSPEIIIQRIVGRAPKEVTEFCNWGVSWWKIHDIIMENMKNNNKHQGRLFNYLKPIENTL